MCEEPIAYNFKVVVRSTIEHAIQWQLAMGAWNPGKFSYFERVATGNCLADSCKQLVRVNQIAAGSRLSTWIFPVHFFLDLCQDYVDIITKFNSQIK